MLDLTIVIPVKNDQTNLQVCLQAIGPSFASHVVVVDSNSCDDTASVARNMNAELINFQWNGSFPKKRNWYLDNFPPSTQWVLFLDADEILNSKVKNEISNNLLSTTHQAFKLSYTNYFLGKRMRGGLPLRKIALFQSANIRYERVEEDNWSDCDMEVHEHPIVAGSVGVIKSKIDHIDLRGIDSYLRKHNDYAAWEAKRIHTLLISKNHQIHLSNQQRFKYFLMRSTYGGFIYFLINYFVMGSWRDGSIGFAFSLFKATYFTQVACRLIELNSTE